jgi:hypothetical protein
MVALGLTGWREPAQIANGYYHREHGYRYYHYRRHHYPYYRSHHWQDNG